MHFFAFIFPFKHSPFIFIFISFFLFSQLLPVFIPLLYIFPTNEIRHSVNLGAGVFYPIYIHPCHHLLTSLKSFQLSFSSGSFLYNFHLEGKNRMIISLIHFVSCPPMQSYASYRTSPFPLLFKFYRFPLLPSFFSPPSHFILFPFSFLFPLFFVL
jgi:hypothetical protein